MPANKQKCVHSNPIAKAQHIGFCFAITNRAGTYENNASLLSFFFLSACSGHIEVTSSMLSHSIFRFDNLLTAGKTTASMRARLIYVCIYIYVYISLVLRNSHAIKQFQRTTGTLVSTAEASFFFFFFEERLHSFKSSRSRRPHVVHRLKKVAALEKTPSIHTQQSVSMTIHSTAFKKENMIYFCPAVQNSACNVITHKRHRPALQSHFTVQQHPNT